METAEVQQTMRGFFFSIILYFEREKYKKKILVNPTAQDKTRGFDDASHQSIETPANRLTPPLPPLLPTPYPGWSSSARAWRQRPTTSSRPSPWSTPSASCSTTRCSSAAPAPAPNTSASAPAGTIATARWRCVGIAYDR